MMAIAFLVAITSIGVPLGEVSQPYLTLDPGGHTAQVARVLFTPDDRQVFTVSLDKSIRVWDVKSGRMRRVFRPPIGDGYEGSFYAAALSGDGQLLAVAGYNKPGGELGHIYLIAVAENRIERTLVGHTHDVVSLAFSPDGKLLASGSRDNTAILWDVSTGAQRLVLRGHDAHVWGLAFSPDSLWLATGSHDRTARIWNVTTGQPVLVLNGHADKVNSVAWSPDGRTIATGAFDQRINLWNPDGTLRQTYQPMGNVVTTVAFSSDSRRLLVTLGGVASDVKESHILDVVASRWLTRFAEHARSVITGSLSMDGTLAATADWDGVVHLWRTDTGARTRSLVPDTRIPWSAGWGPDSRTIAWGLTDRNKTIAAGNPLERTFRPEDLSFGEAPGADATVARLIRGTQRLFANDEATNVSVLNNNVVQAVLRLPPEDTEDTIRCCTLLPGDRVVLGTDFKLHVYDSNTGRVIRTLRGHTAPVYAIAPSPDGRYLLSASSDLTLRVWDCDRDLPLLSLFFAGSEWIAWTPEGYYAASLGGEQLMGWHVNNGPDRMATYYPASQFRKTLYRPDVIKRLLAAGSTARALADADRQNGRPTNLTEVGKVLPPRVKLLAPAQARLRQTQGMVEVRAAANPAAGRAVTSMQLLIGGRPHPEARTLFRDNVPADVAVSWNVNLPPGAHRLSVKAKSAVSDSVSDEAEVIVAGTNSDGANVTPDLFLLAVGINAYREQPLNAATPDARSIAESFRRHSRSLFKRIDVKLVLDDNATRRDIREAFRWLRAQVKPGDVAVVFYAGHGVALDQFYLVPVDVNLHNLRGTGIPSDELRDQLQLPCDTLLLLDACYSGSYDPAKKRALPEATDRAVRELVYDEGMVVMSGANKEQEAGEEQSKQHGYFTRALIEGLAGKAKADESGMIDIASLWAFVAPLVPKLALDDGADEQTPTLSPASRLRSFALSKP
jgi:WD40 repeat protein